ncbi:MAG: regulatory signaling modulator protein AmpE [Betaproteobacteria bacterium]|nr:regulatory signaling modulator protein AmpE [Betaproteobacteria bacterium]MDE1980791.1 regulatory signaling modulator protein AmpE [Betaproteobacteria bacterium]MDE2131453.1 regulatory signaling modulator protein AmpE [Betaproteobacteria bacterium]MDE2211546.1 regulatory signaling modulator protein AmpE [Betaproteobacteria bacterium]MDE2353534.1 regulatory signaling modulator protein AmpE [Betaproteobacteria bacterium]
MNIFSILIALLLEPYRPASVQARVFAAFDRYARSLDDLLNSGERHHGIAAWVLAVVPLLVAAGAIYFLAGHVGAGLGWVLDVLVLTAMLDFRPVLKRLTSLQRDLRHAEQGSVAERLGFSPDSPVGQPEMVARAIELAVMDIHTRLLAVLFWYCVLPGPVGALLYLMAMRLNQLWGSDTRTDFGSFSRSAFFWLDWIPLRVTAFAFAIVGNFEDSLFCWRTQAAGSRSGMRLVLASAAGALGIRLGDSSSPQRLYGGLELGVGEFPDLDHLRSAEGMIWRTLVLWLIVIALLTLAAVVGG